MHSVVEKIHLTFNDCVELVTFGTLLIEININLGVAEILLLTDRCQVNSKIVHIIKEISFELLVRY